MTCECRTGGFGGYMRIVLCILCAASILVPSLTFAAGSDAIFSSIAKKADKYLDLASKQENAKKDAWYPQPFSTTKSSVQNDLNKLLDDVLLTLADDQALAHKKEITALANKNNELDKKIADLETQRISAPLEKKSYEIWVNDVRNIEKKIKQHKDQIEANKHTIEDRKEAIRTRLAKAGIPLSSEQVDSMINIVTGDDTLHAMAVQKNVRVVLMKLEGLLSKGENIHIARKYYSIFLMATKAYSRELTLFIERIDTKYQPKLSAIRAENNKLMSETKKLAKKDNGKGYLNNLRAQEITEKAAQLYATHLALQRKHLEERHKEVSRILMLAENTYKTVTISHALYEVMSEGLNSYNSLMELPLIDPIPFENTDLERKFQELTQKLRQ